MRRCRGCGCTDLTACTLADGGPCWWVAEDLCSGCAVDAEDDLGAEDIDDGEGYRLDQRSGLWVPTGSYEA